MPRQTSYGLARKSSGDARRGGYPRSGPRARHLDTDDGCVVEVFHTEGEESPKLLGSIKEMPRGFKNYGQRFPTVYKRGYQVTIGVGAAFVVAGLTGLFVVESLRGAIGGIMFSLIGAVFMALGSRDLIQKRCATRRPSTCRSSTPSRRVIVHMRM